MADPKPKPKPKPPPPNKTPVVGRTVEVTVVARFKTPWVGNTKREIEAMKKKVWNPGLVDFLAVANVPNTGTTKKNARTEIIEVSSFGEMLGAMLNGPDGKPRPPGSLRRFNIITHANPDVYALSGDVKENGEVEFNTKKKVTENDPTGQMAGAIDVAAVQMLNNEGKDIRDQIRRIFAPSADMALFLCHGGVGQGALLMTDMAQTFNVVVRGYEDEVHYEPREQPDGSILRGLTSKSDTGFAPGYPTTVDVPQELKGEHLLRFTATKPKPQKPMP